MTTPTRPAIDLPTLMSVAAVVSLLSVVLHEAAGHGSSCLLLGGHARAWSAYYFDCDYAAMSVIGRRLVAAAGNTVNVLTALVAFTALRTTHRNMSDTTRVFWWLLMTENLMIWAGYFLFSGVSGIGDWGGSVDGVLQGLNVNLWRVVLAVGGTVLYVLSVLFCARQMAGLIGGDASSRERRTRALTFPAYLTGGVLAVLIGLLNPQGVVIVLTSAAAATLGGTSGLMWLPSVLPRSAQHIADASSALTVTRQWRWIVAAAVGTVTYAAVLGPTLTFRR